MKIFFKNFINAFPSPCFYGYEPSPFRINLIPRDCISYLYLNIFTNSGLSGKLSIVLCIFSFVSINFNFIFRRLDISKLSQCFIYPSVKFFAQLLLTLQKYLKRTHGDKYYFSKSIINISRIYNSV